MIVQSHNSGGRVGSNTETCAHLLGNVISVSGNKQLSLDFQKQAECPSRSVKKVVCQQVPKWIRTAVIRGRVVWWECLLLSHCRSTPHPKCAHVTLRHQRLTPRLCVLREEPPHSPPPPPPPHACTDPLPPTPAPGSVRICYSPLHFTLFDLEFWSLFLFLPLFSPPFLTWLCFILTVVIHEVSRWCLRSANLTLLPLMLPLITWNKPALNLAVFIYFFIFFTKTEGKIITWNSLKGTVGYF